MDPELWLVRPTCTDHFAWHTHHQGPIREFHFTFCDQATPAPIRQFLPMLRPVQHSRTHADQ